MFATNSSCSAFHCGTLPFPAEASARESAGGFFGTSLGRHVVAVSASSSFSTSFSFDAKRWETEIAAALQSAEIKERFDKLGIRPGALGMEGYTALIRSELPRWRAVIAAGNIRAD